MLESGRYIIAGALALVVGFAVIAAILREPEKPLTSQPVTSNESVTTGLTISEVAKHNSPQDCWTIIDGFVYDISGYITAHPGGPVITQACGKDSTSMFNTKGGTGGQHSTFARDILKNFLIGELGQPSPSPTSSGASNATTSPVGSTNASTSIFATITQPLNLAQLSAGTTSTSLRVTTNIAGRCKYSAADTNYDSMTNTFSTTGSTNHRTTVSGLADGVSYTRYVRCQSEQGYSMPYSAFVTWTVATPLPTGLVLDIATVATHNSQSSCWIVINNNVYDITAFLPVHPGGSSIITPWCGAADATGAFNTKSGQGTHSSLAMQLLSSYLLGPLGATQNLNQTLNQTTPLTALVASPINNDILPSGTTSATLSVITGRAATCKYSTSSASYNSMTNTFSTTGSTTHSTSLTTSDGISYTYYVRCQDAAAIEASASVSFSVQTAPPQTGATTYTLADVALHNKQSDCWIIVNNKVYAVTPYIPIHPGGVSRIVNTCGTDASTPFNSKGGQGTHSNKAKSLLSGYYIGDLAGTSSGGGTGGNNTTGGGGSGGGTLNLSGSTGVPAMDQSIAAAYPGATIISSNIEDDGRGEIKIQTASGQSLTVKLNAQGQITETG